MKKFNFFSFLFLMIISLGMLCSCDGEQGPVGPQGEQGIQGEKGEAGNSPQITIGENGNWHIDGVDTGVKAQGEKGNEASSGKSAYEIYLEAHPEYGKTESEWLNDLVNGVLATKCNVFFDVDGGTEIQTQEVRYGSTVTRPDDPVKKGYVFGGWYLEEEFLKEDSIEMIQWQFPYFIVSKDIVLKAKWIKDDHLYFTKFISEEEWKNTLGVENATINLDAKMEENGDCFEVNDIPIKILEGHWVSNFESSDKWECFHYDAEIILDYIELYDKFMYNGDYCYYGVKDTSSEMDIKVYFNEEKQMIKFDISYNSFVSMGSSINYSFEFTDFGTTKEPENLFIDTFEEYIMIGNQEYKAVICSCCEEIISKTPYGTTEQFNEFLSEEEWRNAFTHKNYTMIYDYKEGSYKVSNTTYKIVDDYNYSNCNSDLVYCYNKTSYGNLSLIIYDIIHNHLDYDYYVLNAYNDYKYNGDYCYSKLEFDNYIIVIKIYFNEDKLIEKMTADIENINFSYIDIIATFELFDYNQTAVPTLIHDYEIVRSYEDNLIAYNKCYYCGYINETIIECDTETSNYIKLLYESCYWSYNSYIANDGTLVENYYNYHDKHIYQTQSQDKTIYIESMINADGYLDYYHESEKYEYTYYYYDSYYDSYFDSWNNFILCLYNNFEKFSLVESNSTENDEGTIMFITYDEEILREIFGTYDYKELVHSWFVDSGFYDYPLDEFYFGIKFNVNGSVIENAYAVYPMDSEKYPFLYTRYGIFYSNEVFAEEHPEVLEAYDEMYNLIQKYN